MHAVRWMSPVGPCIIIIFYLVFQLKIDQLGSGRAWAETNIAEYTIVFAEGDRNHIRHASERVNTSLLAEREHPHLGIIQGWDAFCDALNHAAIVPLHSGDFTFVRKIGYESVSSVLDVFVTNVDRTSEPLYDPLPDRLPTSGAESMDHSPIGLNWVFARRQRRGFSRTGEASSANIRRPLPTWLLHDRTFCHILNRHVEEWLEHRSLGGTGLLEFSNLVYKSYYETGFDFLRGNLIEAVTPRHRLEVTLKALQHLDARVDFYVNYSNVEKWCSIYPPAPFINSYLC